MLSSPPASTTSSSITTSKTATTAGDLSATAMVPSQCATASSDLQHQQQHPQPGTTPTEMTISTTPSPMDSSPDDECSTGGGSGTGTVGDDTLSLTTVKEIKMCVECQQPIKDQFMMCVGDCFWHESCIHCTVCRMILTQSCFIKEKKLYCKTDYRRIYSTKCSSCSQPISATELVMRAQENIYHMSCFACFQCGRQLQKGDYFALQGQLPICKFDLERECLQRNFGEANNAACSPKMSDLGLSMHTAGAQMSTMLESHLTLLQPNTPASRSGALSPSDAFSPRASNNNNNTNGNGVCDQPIMLKQPQSVKSEPYLSPTHTNTSGGGHSLLNGNTPVIKQDGRRGPKRPRTILTTAQRRAFKSSFEISQKPCRKVRETLAKETGLSVRIVQVWFQNQRAKLKKIQRKQQQQQMTHAQGSGMLLGHESESGGIGSHSSDKSKDDSCDEDEDDESREFSLPSMPYMIQSPGEGSYYSARDEDGYTKSELGALDDSETSLCEMDDSGSSVMRITSSTDLAPSNLLSLTASGGVGLQVSSSTTTTNMMLDSGNDHASPVSAQQMFGLGGPNVSMFGPSMGGQLSPHLTSSVASSSSVSSYHHGATGPSMTPIDKLYSMQSSYFNNPPECEC